MAKNKTPMADRLPLGKFLAWKSSDITSAGVFLIVTTYMSLFCTDYLGMTPLALVISEDFHARNLPRGRRSALDCLFFAIMLSPYYFLGVLP